MKKNSFQYWLIHDADRKYRDEALGYLNHPIRRWFWTAFAGAFALLNAVTGSAFWTVFFLLITGLNAWVMEQTIEAAKIIRSNKEESSDSRA